MGELLKSLDLEFASEKQIKFAGMNPPLLD